MSEPASIVIIEDDADINEVVAVHLRRNGFACTQAFSGSEGRLLLSGSEPFDLVITDLMLPGMAGEDVVRLVRARGDMPVIVMSARTTAADKVALLKLGADDYLTKPFDLDELLARVQVQLRHADVRRASASGAPSDERLPEPAAAAAMRYKDWTLDVDARTLSVREEPVRLTRLEFNILEASCDVRARCSRSASCSRSHGTRKARSRRRPSTCTSATSAASCAPRIRPAR